jgi:hypothetical protein
VAPLLMRQRDERFALARAVAVVHPARRVIAYHLLWRDDAHGAWIPGTVPTDEEVVWVGVDTTGAPAELWTYWHGAILHAPWPGRQPVVDVQWGKHGSLPRATRPGDLPRLRTLNVFYAFTFALPDLALGRLNRPGPLCFLPRLRALPRLRRAARPGRPPRHGRRGARRAADAAARVRRPLLAEAAVAVAGGPERGEGGDVSRPPAHGQAPRPTPAAAGSLCAAPAIYGPAEPAPARACAAGGPTPTRRDGTTDPGT